MTSYAIAPDGVVQIEDVAHLTETRKEEFAAWMVTYVLYRRGVRTKEAFQHAAMATLLAENQTPATLLAANYLVNNTDACIQMAIDRQWIRVYSPE